MKNIIKPASNTPKMEANKYLRKLFITMMI